MIINYPFWGTPIFGNTHVVVLMILAWPGTPSVDTSLSLLHSVNARWKGSTWTDEESGDLTIHLSRIRKAPWEFGNFYLFWLLLGYWILIFAVEAVANFFLYHLFMRLFASNKNIEQTKTSPVTATPLMFMNNSHKILLRIPIPTDRSTHDEQQVRLADKVKVSGVHLLRSSKKGDWSCWCWSAWLSVDFLGGSSKCSSKGAPKELQ